MDTFGEQLVKKTTTGADWAKRIGIAVLGLVLSCLLYTSSELWMKSDVGLPGR